MKNPYDVVLFDLGGVLIELAGVPIWQSWTGADNEAEVWERWLRSTAVRRFESGRAGADEFAREIIAEFGPRVPDHTTSQRDFRGVVVIITPDGLSTDESASLAAEIEAFEAYFASVTGNRASIRLTGLGG